ncbi:MAG: hypothetical protein IPL89_17250 [Acidobacteria bacterium]|nr:hypothetical protein [Acidobacteriota bacterium]
MNGSFGPLPWGIVLPGVVETGRADWGMTCGLVGASKGEPMAFGDSSRVAAPEKLTLFSVPTQMGRRSSSVICGERMM